MLTHKSRGKYIYIRGTFKVATETIEINWTKTNLLSSKSYSKRFIERFKEEWIEEYKTLNSGYRVKNYADATKEMLSDPHESVSSQDEKNLKRTVTYLGSFNLSKINNKLIGQKALECYDNVKKYSKLKYKSLPRDKQIQISSKHATVNRNFITQVSKVMHYAHENKWCEYMRITRFWTLSGKNRPKYTFTLEEIKNCLNSDAFFYTKLLLVFMLYTGARLQEALNVSWNNTNLAGNRPQIDLEKDQIFLWQSKQDDERIVAMHPNLKLWLQKINERNGNLFPWNSLQDKKNKPEGLTNTWKEMLNMAGVDQNKKRHAVRHTYATFLISYANANDSELMDLGGWKSRDMISVYGSTVPEQTRKKINLLP
tara:strand:+ start:1717 stop:2823 length:1107 start_codon:yes stop_codon:yes gene_type:complete